jgi:hypothetical protein
MADCHSIDEVRCKPCADCSKALSEPELIVALKEPDTIMSLVAQT